MKRPMLIRRLPRSGRARRWRRTASPRSRYSTRRPETAPMAPSASSNAATRFSIDARLSGLAPGAHGFHIYENSSSDGMIAGGHFNPTAKPHGDPGSAEHHAGDMPALVADASGNATLQVELAPMTVGADVTDVVGKAVIVHKDADDYATQPTGISGARVACGVIRKP